MIISSYSYLYTNIYIATKIHSYLKNGAQVLTTASYQASFTGFQKHLGLNFEESKKLFQLSVDLAKRARKEHCDEEVNLGITTTIS